MLVGPLYVHEAVNVSVPAPVLVRLSEAAPPSASVPANVVLELSLPTVKIDAAIPPF